MTVFHPVRLGIAQCRAIFYRAVLVSSLAFLVLTCREEAFDTGAGARLAFSTDTVSFDTVFTAVGSTTLSFKVYNRGNRPVKIKNVWLAGGSESFFRLNIDGIPGWQSEDVEIGRDDSLFIFVAVTIDPQNVNNPFVVSDSVVFDLNGKLQNVKLLAYGQDVHLIDGEIVSTQTWINDKPYLVYNSFAIDTSAILSIEPGCKLYFHKNSSLIVWGRLLVNGTIENPVEFRHDRLEEFYDVVAGQWGTIYIDPMSTGNLINGAIIRNGIAGIQIGFPSDSKVPQLTLSNSVIRNKSFAGIYAFGADINCYNCVIADCAGAAAALLKGGNYRFTHCTVSNSGVYGIARSGPSIVLSNVFYNLEFVPELNEYAYVERTGDLERADFGNCILYGNLNHEFQFASIGTHQFNYLFTHCLVKMNTDSVDLGDREHFRSLVLNEDPLFVNITDRYHLDFSLDTLSPAKDKGSRDISAGFPYLETDLAGNSRLSDILPDMGAYERKEE